jgi:hypothetical protein
MSNSMVAFRAIKAFGELVFITIPSAIGVWQAPTKVRAPSNSTTHTRQVPVGTMSGL